MLTSVVHAIVSSRRLAVLLVSVFGGWALVGAAPSEAAPRGCVTRDFSRSEQLTYQPCVVDLQGMLDNLVKHQIIWNPPPSPQLLPVGQDGMYGNYTYGDVALFNALAGVPGTPLGEHKGRATPQTWSLLCSLARDLTTHKGDDYVNAGCPTLRGFPG